MCVDILLKRIVWLLVSVVIKSKGSSEDAQEPVYKENAASFGLRECGADSKFTGIPLLITPLFFFTPGHFVFKMFSSRIICNEKEMSTK